MSPTPSPEPQPADVPASGPRRAFRDTGRKSGTAPFPGMIATIIFILAFSGLAVVIFNLLGWGSTTGGLIPAETDLPSLMTTTLFLFAIGVAGSFIRLKTLQAQRRQR